MAVVHQRIKPDDGALGSVHRLQAERRLNHQYAVFRVLLPEEILKRRSIEFLTREPNTKLDISTMMSSIIFCCSMKSACNSLEGCLNNVVRISPTKVFPFKFRISPKVKSEKDQARY